MQADMMLALHFGWTAVYPVAHADGGKIPLITSDLALIGTTIHRVAQLTLLESNLDLLEESAQDLLQRETLDEPDLVAIGSKVKRTEAVAA